MAGLGVGRQGLKAGTREPGLDSLLCSLFSQQPESCEWAEFQDHSGLQGLLVIFLEAAACCWSCHMTEAGLQPHQACRPPLLLTWTALSGHHSLPADGFPKLQCCRKGLRRAGWQRLDFRSFWILCLMPHGCHLPGQTWVRLTAYVP